MCNLLGGLAFLPFLSSFLVYFLVNLSLMFMFRWKAVVGGLGNSCCRSLFFMRSHPLCFGARRVIVGRGSGREPTVFATFGSRGACVGVDFSFAVLLIPQTFFVHLRSSPCSGGCFSGFVFVPSSFLCFRVCLFSLFVFVFQGLSFSLFVFVFQGLSFSLFVFVFQGLSFPSSFLYFRVCLFPLFCWYAARAAVPSVFALASVVAGCALSRCGVLALLGS